MNIFTCKFFAVAMLLLMALSSSATAQLEHLNVDRLIKEMRERGMSELLVRLSRDGSIKDPADAKKLEVEMLIMRAQTPVPGNVNDLVERRESLEKGMAEFQALISGNRDNTKRPLWQTDMSLHLIYTRMSLNDLADDFYEFGIPTPEQTRIFESGASLAAESLFDASIFLSKLQRELPRADNYNQTYVNTGRWEEMMDEYFKTKVPFMLAHAAYWASLLPDSHPYFQNLGKNPNIPLQATNPAGERARLLNASIDAISNIPTELATKYGIPQRPSDFIKAKAMARLGQHNDAIGILDKVAQAGKDDLMAFRANLMRAVALELRDKKPDAAVESLEMLKDHPLTQGGVAFAILIADLQHRLLMKHVGKDQKKLEAAYMPYDALFADKRLGQRTEAARMFVFTRWTKQFAGQKQDTLPPMVLSGMGEMERILGNELVAKWAAFQKQEKETEAAAAMKEARVHLNACIDTSDSLIRRADVPPEVKARARYNKAYATYLSNPEDGTAFLAAAAIWTELANELPEHPLAEEAINLAIRFLYNLHIQPARADGVDAAYRNTAAVLYSKLGHTAVADDQRVYYTFNVLQAEGKYKEAAESYEKLPLQHRDYVEGQREWLYCQMQLWNPMPEGEPKDLRRDALRDEANRIERIARRALEEEASTTKQVQVMKNTLADIVLRKVELDIHAKKWDDADKALRDFASDYPGDPDLIRQAISRRIMVKVKQGDSAEAVKLAEELVTSSGDDKEKQAAAAGTIDAALAELSDDIEDLRYAAEITPGQIQRDEFAERATKQAAASDKLADMLLDWGLKNGAEPDDLFRYRLIKVRSSLLTGKIDDAVKVLQPLINADPSEPRVIYLQGEVLFSKGDRASLIQALGVYDKITSDEATRAVKLTADMAPAVRQQRDILNRIWWQSWLRALQIYDKLNEQVALIPRLVAQLEGQYPELGGPALKPKFQQLANKHRK